MAPLQIMRVWPSASPTTTERRRRSKSNGSSSTACQRSASSSALSPGAMGVSSVPSARGALDDGAVDEVLHARGEVAVEEGVAQHARIVVSVEVKVALQDHAVLR